MIEIINYGNCQFGHLNYLLTKLLPAKKYSLSYFSNNARTGNLKSRSEVLQAIAGADILIYQPSSKNGAEISKADILNVAKHTCLPVTFEYVFNHGVYSLCHAPFAREHSYGKIYGEECILELMNNKSPEDIIRDYKEGAINFKLKDRFNFCIDEMQSRETISNTDIKLVEFIKSLYRNEKLLHTHNHPTNTLFFEIIRQFMKIASLPINVAKLKDLKAEELKETNCPISPYDVAIHGYKFEPHKDWFQRGSKLIHLILGRAESMSDRISRFLF